MASKQTRDVADVFDDWARTGRDEGMAKRHLLTAAPVLESIPFDEGTRVIDLGTGNGWAAQHAAEQGADAVGVDAARYMLARARERARTVGWVQADLTNLPLDGESFDVAFSMEALYYPASVHAALTEAYRVLAPGGRLHALIDYYEENTASHAWPEETGVSMHLLSQAGWADAFEDAGFVDVDTERILSDADATADWKAEHGSLHVHGRRPA